MKPQGMLIGYHRGELLRLTIGRVRAISAVLSETLSGEFAAGSALAYLSGNSVAEVVLSLACRRAGLIECPLDQRSPAQEIGRRVGLLGGHLWDRERVDRAFERASDSPGSGGVHSPPIRPHHADRPALVLWTSGTTGQPRGVTLSHRSLAGNARAKLSAVPQYATDVRLTVLPLCHAYARTCDLGTWQQVGGTLAVTLGWEGLRGLAPIVRPTLVNTVPSIADRLLEHDLKELGLHRLRLLGCGGAAISTQSFERWRERGVTVIQGYGLTETSPVICSATPENAAPGLVGRLVDQWQARLDEGELLVRGPHLMLGYWRDPRATQAKVDSAGWLRTGDRVEIDRASGQYRILGRRDDVIVMPDGTKIDPAVIEREACGRPGVKHALLIRRNGQLQLWIDGTGVPGDLPTHHRIGIHHFATPLSRERGELSAKGTPRRHRILSNRFPGQG